MIGCIICGEPMTEKITKSGNLWLRCGRDNVNLYVNGEENIEALRSLSAEPEPKSPKPKPASRPVVETPEIQALVQEMRRLGKEVGALKNAMKGPRTGLDVFREKQRTLSS